MMWQRTEKQVQMLYLIFLLSIPLKLAARKVHMLPEEKSLLLRSHLLTVLRKCQCRAILTVRVMALRVHLNQKAEVRKLYLQKMLQRGNNQWFLTTKEKMLSLKHMEKSILFQQKRLL
nr:MAG TPA: hypothetical protein [Caudoviricetes sp.]